jgi:hypothetical protein
MTNAQWDQLVKRTYDDLLLDLFACSTDQSLMEDFALRVRSPRSAPAPEKRLTGAHLAHVIEDFTRRSLLSDLAHLLRQRMAEGMIAEGWQLYAVREPASVRLPVSARLPPEQPKVYYVAIAPQGDASILVAAVDA